MTTSELEAKYESKKTALGLETQWGEEGLRKVRLTQDHAIYAGMVEAMDAAVGDVLAALEEAGIADNTIVIFTSDNGGLSTSEGHPTSNLPLRGGKGWLYEGGILEPTIVKWPGQLQPNTVSDHLVSSVDYFPSILEMLGIVGPSTDGKSMLQALKGESTPERAVFWHYPHYGNQGGSPGGAIRKGEWKLIQFFETGKLELYNMIEDPSESMDLSSIHPDKTSELITELKAWQEETGAIFPEPTDTTE